MDFSRLEWGRGAKDTAVEKQQKYAVTRQNRPLRSFRKGCGASAKQRCGQNARWGVNAKVRYKRKGFLEGAVRTQKDEPKLVLVRSIFYTFQAGKMLAVYFACFPVEKNHIAA